jgi:hypothetical protein
MDVQHRRQMAGGQPREKAHDAQYEPLWTSDSDLPGHALGCPFQSVDDRPQQLHELQDVRQLCVLRSAVTGVDDRHFI